MSGPTTCMMMSPESVLAVVLAATAIEAVRGIARAEGEAAALREANAQARQAQGQRQSQTQQQGLADLQAQARQAEQRLAQLAELCERLGGGAAMQGALKEIQPTRPQSDDYEAWAEYLRSIQAFGLQAEQVLMTAAAARPPGDGDEGAWLSLALSDTAVQAAGQAADKAAAPSARLLQRIAHLGPVPDDMAAVAAELDATADTGRAALLTSELRRQIQLHAEAAMQAQVQAAQALVLEQSLQDLGYEVEGIESTLFVEGGVAHFRKSHWGDYMVRLRVADDGQSVNFNVVRAVDDPARAEVSVQDHLAEDRWCAEFPALMRALAARGMPLHVTRRLAAGELPVQRVARQDLPRFSADEPQRRRAAPRAAKPLP